MWFLPDVNKKRVTKHKCYICEKSASRVSEYIMDTPCGLKLIHFNCLNEKNEFEYKLSQEMNNETQI